MHYEIIDCYFNDFFVEIQLKKETWKMFFGRPYWYTSLPNGLNISLTTYENLGYSSIHHSTVPPPLPLPLLSAGGTTSSTKFWKGGWGGGRGSEKNECLGGLKEFLPSIFAWGVYYVSCQKRFLKIKYGFEGSVSNVDLGLFYSCNLI